MTDEFDVDLEDRELLDEIDLLTRLIVAAMPCDHHLSTSGVDVALGLGGSPGSDPDVDPTSRADDGR